MRVTLSNEFTGERDEWFYTGGLHQYLAEELGKVNGCRPRPFTASAISKEARSNGRFAWVLESEHGITESYVNLIPTIEGGDACQRFAVGSRRRGARVLRVSQSRTPGSETRAGRCLGTVWSFVLSMKMREPQFAGQTKEKLSSRESAGIVQGVIKDAFALWLNQHPDQGEKIAMLAIANAQQRFKDSQKIARKRIVAGPALPGQTRRLRQPGSGARRVISGRG